MNDIGKRITDKIIQIHGGKDFTIAFLPYKRSMWNSMESVYEECKAAGARTYIMPLPYLRKTEQPGEEHEILDKDIFERATSITLLPEFHTDYLVIHYPYDGNNKVTSMLEKYYTANLRKFGKVIYIPYSCTNMRQLRVQPGIANVDYAFLGSEAEAEAFIREWRELGVDFTGRAFGLGSPKMDTIKKLSLGSATVIINSLGPFLSDPYYRMLKYTEAARDEREKGREVIFRPHPLLRQTIYSMRPDTETNYLAMLKIMENDGVEIDETENLEGTLRRANYLISDPSSVLEMWTNAGRRYRVI